MNPILMFKQLHDHEARLARIEALAGIDSTGAPVKPAADPAPAPAPAEPPPPPPPPAPPAPAEDVQLADPPAGVDEITDADLG